MVQNPYKDTKHPMVLTGMIIIKTIIEILNIQRF